MTTNDQDEQLKKGYLIIPIGLPGYTQMPKSLDEFNMLRKQSEFPINSFKHKRSNMHPVSNIQNFPTETGVSLTCNFTPMKGGNGFILSCPNTVENIMLTNWYQCKWTIMFSLLFLLQ